MYSPLKRYGRACLAALGVTAAGLVAGQATAAPIVVSGTATYHARIAVPPSTVFEATVERLGPEGAATVVGQFRKDPSGLPPYPFEISYPAAADGRDLLRVRLVDGGQVLFAAESELAGGQAAKPVELVMKPVPSQPAAPGLGSLPASFAGDLPCADCAAIRWHLDLQADRSYQLRLSYQGKPEAVSLDRIGRWDLGDDGILKLDGADAASRSFRVVGPDRLRKLDREGRPIPSAHNHDLTRLAAYRPIEPKLVLDGLYSYMADAGRIRLCATGQHLPVAAEADNAALESAYAAARTQAAEPLLVSLEGRIAQRPPMEGSGTRPTVIVDRYLGLWPQEGCPDPRAQTPLTNTYWKLTRLRGAAIKPEPGKREAHLILQEQDSRVVGSGGCNRFTGSYRLEGAQLSFGRAASTMMACVAGMAEEHALHAALAEVAGWRVDGKHLELLDGGGKVLARLEAVALRQ